MVTSLNDDFVFLFFSLLFSFSLSSLLSLPITTQKIPSSEQRLHKKIRWFVTDVVDDVMLTLIIPVHHFLSQYYINAIMPSAIIYKLLLMHQMPHFIRIPKTTNHPPTNQPYNQINKQQTLKKTTTTKSLRLLHHQIVRFVRDLHYLNLNVVNINRPDHNNDRCVPKMLCVFTQKITSHSSPNHGFHPNKTIKCATTPNDALAPTQNY